MGERIHHYILKRFFSCVRLLDIFLASFLYCLKFCREGYDFFPVDGNGFLSCGRAEGMVDERMRSEILATEKKVSMEEVMGQLAQQNRYLSVLHEMTLRVVNRLDVYELVQVSLEQASELAGVKHAYAYLIDEARQVAVVTHGLGAYVTYIGVEIKKGEGFAGYIWQSGEPLAVEDYNTWEHKVGHLNREEKWDMFGVPIFSNGQVAGIIGLSHMDSSSPLTKDLLEILSRFAALVSIALDNARLYEEAQREIQSRRQMEQALEESKKQYHWLLENSYEAIAIYEFLDDWEKYGRFVEVNENACAFFGYSKEELLTMSPMDLTIGKTTEERIQTNWRLSEGKRVVNEIKILAKDGRILEAEVIQNVFESNGRRLVFAALHDITRRKHAEAEKLRLQKKEAMLERLASLGTMVAGVIHEINQPLQAMGVSVGGLQYWHHKGKILSDDKVLESYERIANQVKRIEKIVRHLRNFVQYSHSEDMAPVHWKQVVLGAFDLIGSQLEGHGVKVHCRVAENLPPVLGNAGRLEEVVINILVNAMQAMDKVSVAKKEIAIMSWADANQVYLEIEDTGPGFRQEVLDKLFEPFFSTKASNEGMGLGLALAQSIILSHGGQIHARNTEQGASFIIELPIYSVPSLL